MSTTRLLLACSIALALGACSETQPPPISAADPSQPDQPADISSEVNQQQQPGNGGSRSYRPPQLKTRPLAGR